MINSLSEFIFFFETGSCYIAQAGLNSSNSPGWLEQLMVIDSPSDF